MGDAFNLKEWHAQCVMLFHEFQVNKYSKKGLWCDHSSSLSRHSSWKLGFGLVVTVPHTSYMWEFEFACSVISQSPDCDLKLACVGGIPDKNSLLCWLLAWSFDQEVAELRKEKRNATLCERTHARSITNQVCENSCHPLFEIAVECCKWGHPQSSSSAAQNDHFEWNLWTIPNIISFTSENLFLQAICFQDYLVKICVIGLSRWKSFLPLFCFSASSLRQVTQQGNLQGWFNNSESFEAESRSI